MSFAPVLDHPRSAGFLTSFLLHAALFLLGGFILIRPIEYAVESGNGGIEVSLTAAPAETAIENISAVPHTAEEADPEMSLPKEVETAPPAESVLKGGGGAFTEARPNYLKNPAPPYPKEAREKGWEGVVILKVLVLADGSVGDIQEEQSSGHEPLDRSAKETIRRWRFKPAKAGPVSLESWVRIPVRFSLKDRPPK